MMARSSSARNPMDSTRRRPSPTGRSRGTILPSRASTSPSSPSRRGTEKPQMSASRTPTARPRRARATARLTVTEDLPTPPLPEAMASTRVVGGTAVSGAPSRAFQRARAITAAFSSGVHLADGDARPRSPRACPPTRPRTSRSIWARSGQAATVRATATATVPAASTPTERTMPRSTMLSPSSGSMTARQRRPDVVGRRGVGTGGHGPNSTWPARPFPPAAAGPVTWGARDPDLGRTRRGGSCDHDHEHR